MTDLRAGACGALTPGKNLELRSERKSTARSVSRCALAHPSDHGVDGGFWRRVARRHLTHARIRTLQRLNERACGWRVWVNEQALVTTDPRSHADERIIRPRHVTDFAAAAADDGRHIFRERSDWRHGIAKRIARRDRREVLARRSGVAVDCHRGRQIDAAPATCSGDRAGRSGGTLTAPRYDECRNSDGCRESRHECADSP